MSNEMVMRKKTIFQEVRNVIKFLFVSATKIDFKTSSLAMQMLS